MQFLSEPYVHPHQKLLEAQRGISDICFDQSFEFQQRFLVKNHMVELFCCDASRLEAKVDSIRWKLMVMFYTGKPLFLCSGDNLAIDDQCSRAIMIIG